MLVALYVPGDRPERFAKAFATGADQVILDLEDAVAPGHKELGRHAVAELLAGSVPGRVAVRPNGAGSPWHEADLAMLAQARSRPALRLPKVEGPDDVDRVLERLGDSSGEPWELTCLLESALGVERAYAVASHPAVSGIALGEADLRAELGVTAEVALDWLRVRSVVAARAAGLSAPAMAVHPHLDDDEGLRASCRHGAALGLRGRAAIHPRQVPVIREAFTPTAEEVADARQVVQALAGAAGAVRLPDGRMVDAAMGAEARAVLALAG
ncbi:HpcH/HpaI aldolase/citrate lyase family protein [Microlunatus antarcticus]|uniref:Citrate lyase subunit beta/citryl-CoA lyase n=1 Tax=Microlunatus antarcticus TaxID=53388 RepID=A0A7W5JWP1_9ACTN|nr:citrate lyase subunit beta/citryl-CoA lyase [Microlunatus antarcticus]